MKISYNPNSCKTFRNKWKFYTLEERYLRFLRDRVLDLDDYKSIINKIFSEDTFFCGENLSSIFENFSGFKYADRSYRKPEHILKLIRRIESENELEKYSDLNPIYSRSPNITKKKER